MVNGKTYNTNLQTLRKAAGYKSAREFALSIGMNPKTYTNYEQGVRMMGLEVALNLTDTLGCTLNDLVCYELGINMKTNLQALRKAAGFKSARAFAEHIGMNLRTYTSYEQGEAVMSLEVAWNLANVLNCSLDELAGRTPPVIEQSALDPCKATGFNFAQARSSRNVTQQELADMIGEKVRPAINTTPNAYYLNELFFEMKQENCEYVVMEVSSHSLIFENVYGLTFDVAMFTNLTQDHLDFHGTIEEYFLAKKKLFSMCKTAVINSDDKYGERLLEDIKCKAVTYSAQNMADYTAKAINCLPNQINYKLLTENLTHISVNTGGNFTVYNSLCAIACALEIGISLEDITSALADFGGVKGRAEVVPNTKDFTVIIDYAHTPDGLKNILKTFKECAKNRLIVLFGCGGDRDKSKRSLMGEIASIYADYVIVTSDNPRTENPTEIIEDIMKGIPSSLFCGKVIEDRREAIKFALSIGQKDDIIVLAGKGHEDYQIIGKEKFPFDERVIIKDALAELK
ncbi:MAG: UDP-N-acetylmuramoyl-L-alanyl-D-glutamate--2,6-diaminopimelate ligase [Bacteroidaceae bacterium]|nr:UDP-N-acetylmuramoyl-L-alanyl-D-glutamate--2,6-diaminopimelate ligase [Bacteroidaceae bacterium]